MLWEECQHVWGGGEVLTCLGKGVSTCLVGGGGGERGLTCLGKGVHALWGDNMIKCLGGEGQHAFGGGLQGKRY